MGKAINSYKFHLKIGKILRNIADKQGIGENNRPIDPTAATRWHTFKKSKDVSSQF